MLTTIDFEAFHIPGARAYDGNVLPYGLKVVSQDSTTSSPTVEDAAAALRSLAESGKLTELLNRHGAVLFRGIGSPSAETFSQLVCAAEQGRGSEEHEQIGLAGKRTPIAKSIWTANEGPKDRRFYQHNEVSNVQVQAVSHSISAYLPCRLSTQDTRDSQRTFISTA